MGTLFGTLGIALGSLGADQGAVDITSNNIANVNTPGYSREQVSLLENPPVQVGNVLYGTGVTLGPTTSVRDSLLNMRIDQENQSGSQLNSFLGTMNQVQTIFNETNGSGLQAPLTAFFNSLTQLSTDPTNSSYRQGVITSGQNLASAFQQDSSNLQSLQSSTDLSVVQSVDQINQLSQQIASLNVQISGLEGVGQDPGTFLDQRTNLVNQLSGLIGINETPAGDGSLTISTANGAALVTGGQAFSLATEVNSTTTYHDVYAQGTDITSAISGGTLGGDIQARDQSIPGVLNQLDTLAYNLATSFNAQSKAGFDANGNAGVNFFTQPTGVAGAASSIAVAISDPNLVAASSDGTSGSNGNAQALANLQNQASVNGQTPYNYYSNLVFQIGNQVSQAQSEQTAVGLVQQQLSDQRGAISGVSLDTALNSAVQAVTQAISLGVEGANGTLSDADRQAIAQQLTGIQNQILSVANQTYQGNYVFAGTATSTVPFVLDATQPDGVKYNGNTGVNSVQISSGQTIPVNVPGSQIFTNPSGNLLGALNGLITALQNNSGIDAANTNLNQAFAQLNTQRVFYGNELQQLQSSQTFLNSDKLQLATQQNSLVGADLATSITNLEQASTATSAILNATNQILSTLNLLDYLK